MKVQCRILLSFFCFWAKLKRRSPIMKKLSIFCATPLMVPFFTRTSVTYLLQSLLNCARCFFSSSGLAGGWLNNLHISSDPRPEVKPRDHVPFLCCAGFRHPGYVIGRNHVIPDIYTTDLTNKGLATIKPSSHWVLFLPKHHSAATRDLVTDTEAWPVTFSFAVFVKLPWARGVLPSETNVVPCAIVGRHVCTAE